MKEGTTQQLLNSMFRIQKEWEEHFNELVTRAQLQAITESMYNELVRVARESIELLTQVQPGDTIPKEWGTKRDELVARAKEFIIDD
ncbi:hypothetical protein EPA93_22195 [Ktedonosporobacter rubrisoli]|uniref:Uncharacterized protein n=1 Tax=Ktedonosporobacter rubrisoli TaxID=2509675 RepID=A0A4P6JSN6_KTERU|nr:hypothetical protein [Ktedonosporobacter rubrisoli]QBD78557.1 hypothetical protein EPA93_22195 [Ktedonosporobacter rubrisoli]